MSRLTAAHCPEEPLGGAVRIEVLSRTGRFDIEFEVPDDITEWTSAATAAGISGRPEVGAAVCVVGEVEGVGDGDDTVVEVGLGSGVLLVDVPAGRPDLSEGDLISFRISEIRLHPYFL